MSKPSQHKAERLRKKKQKKQERDKPFQARKSDESKFPDIVYAEGNGNPRFIEAVREAIREVVRDHRRLLSPGMTGYFHRVKTEGLGPVMADIKEAARLAGDESTIGGLSRGEWELLMALGSLVVSRLSNDKIKAYLPFSDVNIIPGVPRPNTILVQFHSMMTAKTPNGTIHYSRHRPTVEINGERKVVAFSNHAAERICERAVDEWRTYSDMSNAYGLLAYCVYFEPARLARDQPGFAMYNSCYEENEGVRSYMEELLGRIEPHKKYYYRVGYCPAVIHDEFIVAKTLLLPGMDGTPEYEAVLKKRVKSLEERKEMRKRIEGMVYPKLFEVDALNLMREFHDAGIPQVVSIDQTVFRYD